MDAEGRQPGKPVTVDRGEQRVPIGLEVPRVVVHPDAVGEHGPLDPQDVVPRRLAAARQLPEHHREHRATDGRRRVDRDVPVPHHPPQRLAHHDLVCREVGFGDQPTVRGHSSRAPGRPRRWEGARGHPSERRRRGPLRVSWLRATSLRCEGGPVGRRVTEECAVVLPEEGVADDKRVAGRCAPEA